MERKISKYRYMFLTCIALIIILGIPKDIVLAATKEKKDKTVPTIVETLSTTKYTKDSIKITLKVTDKSGIKLVKWETGAKKISYFKEGGKTLKLSKNGTVSVVVKKNATYTFYALDKVGNSVKKKVSITNIDKISPVAEVVFDSETFTNKDLAININVADDVSGVKVVKYLQRTASVNDFLEAGTTIPISKNGSTPFIISENGTYTIYVEDNAFNVTIQSFTISNIDKKAPEASATYSVMNQNATVDLSGKDDVSGIRSAKYIKGNFPFDSEKWESSATNIEDMQNFQVKAAGIYSILVEDYATNRTVITIDIKMEFQAAWISFLEFNKSKTYSEEKFKAYVDTMFDNCVDMKMTAVVVQVRPFGDAMYNSKYFPWSYYASGKQGQSPSYDPLAYMIDAAHMRNLEFHAWVNPYRITKGSTDISKLSVDNPARVWAKNDATKRNVLSYGGSLYYNPACTEVQDLIINGVKELVETYKVDGIHFDDYFYPNLGSKYNSNFDATEYKEYVAACKKAGTVAKSIVIWRRENVNSLVKKTYAAIKSIDSNCVFGISPAGNISNLSSNSSYYVDIKTWLSSSDYVDYICPQIYWSFTHETAPYKKVLNDWIKIKTSDTVNLYVGLATYRAGISESAAKGYKDIGWSKSSTILKNQVIYGRNTGMVDGYMHFRYDSMVEKTASKEMKNLLSILK